MKNFVFISPNFPHIYWNFCKALKEEGFRVLAIGDVKKETLTAEQLASIDDYFYVSSLEDFAQKYQAVAYFAYRYGPIDFLESNNEYWLASDAKLRTMFHITTGKNERTIGMYQSKIKEKQYYAKAHVKTARYCTRLQWKYVASFIKKVGFPIIAKPDHGVGAQKTYLIHNEEEYTSFLKEKEKIKYILEEFIDGDLISFDGVSNAKAEPVFYSNEVFPDPILNIIQGKKDCFYYASQNVPADLLDAGKRVLKAFGAKYRYFHLEFFRLRKSKKGLGQEGDLIGLEVNMRCPGGYTPDLINFAQSEDSYRIWAKAMANHPVTLSSYPKYFAGYVGRRDGVNYEWSDEEIMQKFHPQIKGYDRMPEILSDDLGNRFFMATFESKEQLEDFFLQTMKRKE